MVERNFVHVTIRPSIFDNILLRSAHHSTMGFLTSLLKQRKLFISKRGNSNARYKWTMILPFSWSRRYPVTWKGNFYSQTWPKKRKNRLHDLHTSIFK